MLKKKFFTKKAVSTVLSFSILATTVTGCGKGNAGKTGNIAQDNNSTDANVLLDNAQKMSKDYVFKQTVYDGVFEKGDYLKFLNYIGDKGTAVAISEEGKLKCISFNKDGSDIKSFDIPLDENAVAGASFAMDKDGNLYVSDATHLSKYDAEGKELLSKDTGAIINNMTWSEKYGLVLNTADGIGTYDEQNGFNKIIDSKSVQDKLGNDTICICKGSGDQFFLYTDSYDNPTNLVKIDLDNKSVGELSGAIKDLQFDFFGGEGYDLYARDGYALYGYDSASDKFTMLLDYQDSDLNPFDVRNPVAVSDKEFFAISMDNDLNCSLTSLAKVNPEDVPDKTLITMGGAQFTIDVFINTANFNKSNDKYKIKIVDFTSTYPDAKTMPDMIQAFNLDIVSGKVPDILCLSSWFNPNIENYANKGILLDLSPQFEKGGAFENLDILPNVYEMMKTGDKVYSVVPSFVIDTVVMRESIAKGNTSLTIKDCDELIKSKNVDYNDAFGLLDRTLFIEKAITYNGNKFIDRQNKKCDLNNPEFIEILNFAKNLPEEKEYSDDFETLYVDNKSLFYDIGIGNFNEFKRLKNVVFNENLALLGFPNNNGDNKGFLCPETQFCVSSKIAAPEGAYEFINYMFKLGSENSKYTFPSEKTAFESVVKKASEPPASDDPLAKLDPLSPEEIKTFHSFMYSDECIRSDT